MIRDRKIRIITILAEGEEMFDLTGKRALITGSTQGIGFALAKSLSEAGAAVFINGKKEEKARRAAEYRDLDWTEEYYFATHGDPNDTQSAL